jgi:endonuclease/exonuclease/phosphatase (EEP) superfamily protein YafD
LNGPTVVAGDLNINDQTPAYASLAEILADSWREAGQGFGFTFAKHQSVAGITIPEPFVRIDYIFQSRDLTAKEARVGCGTSSDHCYVIAELVPRS